MFTTRSMGLSALVLAAILAVGAATASADIINPVLTINVLDSGGAVKGSYSVDVPASGLLVWTATFADPGKEIIDSLGNTLAIINGLEVELQGDPVVKVGFNVTAIGSDQTFEFISPVVSFAGLTNPAAYASAGVTVTGNGNGATLTGLLTGSLAYEARYNGGSVFAGLIAPTTAPIDDTATLNDRFPLTGTVAIPGTVTNISSTFKFTLTADDDASGTSRFEVTPEPATLALLGFGAIAMIARRRKA